LDDFIGSSDEVSQEGGRVLGAAPPPIKSPSDGHEAREEGLEEGSSNEWIFVSTAQEAGRELSSLKLTEP